ncbi:hypothetical protein BDV93DRAFT_510867 [Ceratobasidium sp. AG-I]|nr:hypothetical protein BDV93DRAFT_510867 [Ceratobasidium sp. AG-I]
MSLVWITNLLVPLIGPLPDGPGPFIIRTAGGRVNAEDAFRSLRITQKALNNEGYAKALNIIIVHHTQCAAAALKRDEDCELSTVEEATASVRQDAQFIQERLTPKDWPTGPSPPVLTGWVYEMRNGLLHQMHRVSLE